MAVVKCVFQKGYCGCRDAVEHLCSIAGPALSLPGKVPLLADGQRLQVSLKRTQGIHRRRGADRSSARAKLPWCFAHYVPAQGESVQGHLQGKEPSKVLGSCMKSGKL